MHWIYTHTPNTLALTHTGLCTRRRGWTCHQKPFMLRFFFFKKKLFVCKTPFMLRSFLFWVLAKSRWCWCLFSPLKNLFMLRSFCFLGTRQKPFMLRSIFWGGEYCLLTAGSGLFCCILCLFVFLLCVKPLVLSVFYALFFLRFSLFIVTPYFC